MRDHRPRSMLLAIGVIALTIAACGGTDTAAPSDLDEAPETVAPDDDAEAADDQPAPSTDAATPADPEPSPSGGPLDFTARTLAGGDLEVGVYAGDPVVLWMWAPW